MSKSVIAEESLKKHFLELTSSNGYIFGLILGQRSAQRDYIIHVSPFSNLHSKNAEEELETTNVQAFKTLQEISVKSFIAYAKQVTAFLPGGMSILGVFSVGSGDGGVLDPAQASKLQAFMSALFTKLSTDSQVNGGNTTSLEKLVMHFNSTTSKATCKSVNLGDSKWYLSNIEWKFQSQAVKWQEIESHYAFDIKMPVKEKNDVTSLKSNLEVVLKKETTLIKNAHCFFLGEVREPTATLESIVSEGAGDNDDEDDSSIHAELILECAQTADSKVENLKCNGDLVTSGMVYSRIYIHPKSTIGEATMALKEDILQSLRTRFELHTDALIEEEGGSPEEKVVQHDLPRRILIPLPYSQVKLSNYLFPGETAADSLPAVRQLLGFEVDIDNVEEGLEDEADPEALMPILPSEETDVNSPRPQQPDSQQGTVTLYLILALGVLFFALSISMLLVGNDEDLPIKKNA